MTVGDPTPGRPAELALALGRLEQRLLDACAAAGRERSSVTLIAVTKTHPATDVLTLLDLGIRDVGENRDQEAVPKVAAVAAGLAADMTGRAPDSAGRAARPRWHLIGQLQTNKARSVASWADLVHSVDRARLVTALDAAAHERGRVLDCLVQVDLDDAATGGGGRGGAATGGGGRGGASPAQVAALADAIGAASFLRLRGVMAVAPLGVEPAVAFDRLAGIAAAVVAAHPGAGFISAGMSGDLEAAVAAGATHVRVGSALLGSRAPLH